MCGCVCTCFSCLDFFLIDSGAGTATVSAMLERVKVPDGAPGAGTITTAMRLRGVLLTHPDADHIQGMRQLISGEEFVDEKCPLYIQRAFSRKGSGKRSTSFWKKMLDDKVGQQCRWQLKSKINEDGILNQGIFEINWKSWRQHTRHLVVVWVRRRATARQSRHSCTSMCGTPTLQRP